MRVRIVDPSAQTPPFDRSLAAALARAGADVVLETAHFAHGETAPAEGFAVSERFYPRSARMRPGSPARRALGLAEHLPGMLGHRRAGRDADVVHYQWLTVPELDATLLPRGVARVMTAHGFLRGAEGGRLPRRALARMDAVVALTRYGAERLRASGAVDPERVHVIPHGAFDYLARMPQAELPRELAGARGPAIVFFGLVRPYKGVDVLLRAFAGLAGAELWVVGRPLGVDPAELERLARQAKGRVRFVPRFVPEPQVAAIFRRAEIVALPYRDVEQSGVLFTALAFGKPVVASAVGGFPEVVGDHGAGRLVPPGDADALAAALGELLADSRERDRLGAAALSAARGPFSWDAIAARHLELYRSLRAR